MPKRGFVSVLCALFLVAVAPHATAQAGNWSAQQRFTSIAVGEYQAGDSVRFTLTRYRNNFLMQFAGEPEVYVLYADFGAMGSKVLRYDTAATAIQIANWGAMTVYPDNKPEGLPATRNDEASPPAMKPVTQAQLLAAAEDEAAHLAYVSGIRVSFAADWPALTNDPPSRALVLDTLGNTARGLARFAATPGASARFAQRISTVRLQPGNKLLIQISGKTLIVTYNTSLGYMGRASSRAIAFALGRLFKLPVRN